MAVDSNTQCYIDGDTISSKINGLIHDRHVSLAISISEPALRFRQPGA